MGCNSTYLFERLYLFFKRIFSCIKGYIIIFSLLFLIAFVTGILTASKYASDLTYENLIGTMLINFFIREKGVFSLFISLFFGYIILSLTTIFLCKNKFMFIIVFIIFLFSSYIIGFNTCVIVLSFGFVGIVFGVFVFGVFAILLQFTYIIILSLSCKSFSQKNNCEIKKDIVSNSFLFITLGGVLLFLLCILLNIMHIFVIVE